MRYLVVLENPAFGEMTQEIEVLNGTIVEILGVVNQIRKDRKLRDYLFVEALPL